MLFVKQVYLRVSTFCCKAKLFGHTKKDKVYFFNKKKDYFINKFCIS